MPQIKDFPQKPLVSGDDKILLQDSIDNAYKFVEVRGLGQLSKANFNRSYQNQVLSDMPDYYFKFGEIEGNTAFDSSGFGRNAIYSNVQLNQQSLINDANNSSAYFSNEAFAAFSNIYNGSTYTNITGITVECFVSGFNSNTPSVILHLGTHDAKSTFNGIAFELRDRKSSIHIPGINIFDSGVVINANKTHLAWTLKKNSGSNSASFSFYIDGIRRFTSSNHAVNTPSANGYIGKIQYGDFYTGFLDELSIYGVELPDSRIYAHYKSSLLQSQ